MGTAHRVVFIEEEDRLVRVVCSWLESLGYAAHGFTRAADALAFLATEGADVVITGAHVADMSGPQLCARVRDLGGARPPALVGLARPSDGAAACAGYDAIVAYPAPLDAILNAITEVVPRPPTPASGSPAS